MRRRDFITLLGGAATTWPVAAHAQQPERMRRIGALMSFPANDPGGPVRITVLQKALRELGWIVGENFQIDVRWTAADLELMRRYAAELVGLAPSVLVKNGGSHVAALQQASHTIPIVFIGVTDPVGGGLVASLARPGGNATGFTLAEFGSSAKWLELLKELAPRLTRGAVLRNPSLTTSTGQFGAIQLVAPALGVELIPIDDRNTAELDRAITTFARTPGGLIITASPTALNNRDLIVVLAAKNRLPAVYYSRLFVDAGGLLSYGPDTVDQYRQAAVYVDRILKGEKPANLPVRNPTKYETVLNLKTAKALGLSVPQTLLVAADEVIEQ
jgi:putative ABC transport system substrate-binding protein